MKWMVVLLMVVTLCFTVAINSALSKSVSADLFKAMDKSGDSVINLGEYLKACKLGKDKCAEEFKWFDRNNDGKVTLPEYEGKVKN